MTKRKVMVSANYVTKRFDLIERKSEKLKMFFKFWGDGIPSFWAIKGASFDAYAGETIGVIGTNGSGKSTLLEIVAGIREPTSGKLTINGSTSIIAIGAGMRPQLTGRANIRLKGLMQGMTQKEIDDKIDAIIEYSELGDFIDQPVKSYSSGMKSKLGFAISVYSDADVVIIDEALSVGDPTFTQKSIERTKAFKAEGKTIFFVSHSNSQIKQVADRIIWMHHGDIVMDGPLNEVMPAYEKFISKFNGSSEAERYALQTRHKEAQKTFTLEKLRALERNRILLETDQPYKKMTQLDRLTHFTGGRKRKGWFSTLILIVVMLGTAGLMVKQVTGMSTDQVLTQVGLSQPVSADPEPVEVRQNKYTVKQEKNLKEVAEVTGISVSVLKRVNHLESNDVHAGQKLRLSEE